jgi:uncharacterized protein
MGSQELPFDPCPMFSDPHLQAWLSTTKWWISKPKSVQDFVHLEDGDKLTLESTTPEGWKNTDPTVLCVHGLCGSHESSYLMRLVNRLSPQGYKVVRFNMRGCGSGRGHAKNIFHSGRSDDLFEAVKFLKKQFPQSPITLIGFSLGGNIVLKMAGEMGSFGIRFISRVIAICPPVDMRCSASLVEEVAQGLYNRYFYKMIRQEVAYLHKKFKDLPPVELPQDLTLYKFDEMYTAPRVGFEDVEDYYDKCSAKHYVDLITIPCKILFAQDDPIVAHHALDDHTLPANIQIYKTKKGGHMGYLGHPKSPRGFFWLDSLLEEWILESCSKKDL